MIGNPITIAGIPLPSDSPPLLGFHRGACGGRASLALSLGAVAMLSRKQHGRHPQAGTIYYWSLALVATTMSVLAISRWAGGIYHLFILGACRS